jgi:hypothetical protein
MKISLAEVKGIEGSLSKIFEKDVNIKIAYRLSVLLKRLSEEMGMLEEGRVKLVKQYGTEDEKTKSMSVKPENSQAFFDAFNELMQVEIEIPFEPIDLKDLGDIELSAADMAKLSGLIIKCEEDKKKKPSKKKK